MSIEIVAKNGRWHVYETSTEPWALLTVFQTEDEAKAYFSLKRIHAGAVDVKIGAWVPEVLQEYQRCLVCNRSLDAGSKAHVRSIKVITKETTEFNQTTYEVKCLEHTRNRFSRDEPL